MAKPTDSQKVLAQIRKNVQSKKWECLDPTCSNIAINSHLLQQNGILNAISEKGHLIEVKPVDVYKWSPKKSPLEFRRIGIKSAISLPLFCSRHDSEIFKEIEINPIDFSLYKNQLLFSYRAVCSELRKKQQNLEVDERVLNSQNLIGEINKEYITQFMNGTRLGIEDLQFLKAWFEAELEEQKGEFEFSTFNYPLIRVYSSATFSPIDYEKQSPAQETPLPSVFISVIPYEARLNIIVGYHKKYTSEWIKNYTNSWSGLDTDQLENKLTDLFTTRIETWGMSPTLYQNIPLEAKNKLVAYQTNNAMNLSIHQNVDFNLFAWENHG